MRYERPVVVELGARAGRAQGESPLACISGLSAGGPQSCGVGEAALSGCSVGNGGPPDALCVGGFSPGATAPGDCFSGELAFACGAGIAGEPDPFGCNAGPSFV